MGSPEHSRGFASEKLTLGIYLASMSDSAILPYAFTSANAPRGVTEKKCPGETPFGANHPMAAHLNGRSQIIRYQVSLRPTYLFLPNR